MLLDRARVTPVCRTEAGKVSVISTPVLHVDLVNVAVAGWIKLGRNGTRAVRHHWWT